MSKYVKGIIIEYLRQQFQGVENALIVDVQGLNGNQSCLLRRILREQGIRLMVVKNSLARLATRDTPLGPLFEGLDGPAAVVWGGEDIVAVAKAVVSLVKDKEGRFESLTIRRGIVDGTVYDAAGVEEVSRWPSRQDLLAQIAGTLLAPYRQVASCIQSPGAQLASCVEQQSKEDSRKEVA